MRYLNTYGMSIVPGVELSHTEQTFVFKITPQFPQITSLNSSEDFIILSFITPEAPCATNESFSISPAFKPLPFSLPPYGCLVKRFLVPVDLNCVLSII